MKKVVLVGSSGHARVVLEAARNFAVVGFIDSFRPLGEITAGLPVLGAEEDLPRLAKRHRLHGVLMGIGDNWTRYQVAQKLRHLAPQLHFPPVIHPSAIIARRVHLGPGSVVLAGCVIQPDSRLGEFCLLNTRSSLDHDGVMNEASSLAPGVTTGANVHIGAFSAISIGASVLHGRKVGAHSVVGAGSVVTRDIPDHVVAYGAPARVVRSRVEGEKYL